MTRPMIKQHRRPDGVMERPINDCCLVTSVLNVGNMSLANPYGMVTGMFEFVLNKKQD